MNISVGIIGHVDSGKTALAMALSTHQSTAGYDKHPESKRRGITLDVGFSKFDLERFQITLVDCPGHAMFIKSVLTGLRIADFIVLVIDGEKMFQQQTYESLMLMELFNVPSIVCLNKCDKLGEEQQSINLKQIDQFLHKTKISNFTVVKTSTQTDGGVAELRQQLLKVCNQNQENLQKVRQENTTRPLIAQYDHHFAIQGVGNVLTATVLSGKIEINDSVYVQNQLNLSQIKQLEVFKTQVSSASTGDRVGICVKNIDSESLSERGLVVANRKQLLESQYCLTKVRLSRHFKQKLKQNSQFEINFGHETIHCKITILWSSTGDNMDYREAFDSEKDSYIIISNKKHLDELTAKSEYCAVINFCQPIQYLANSKFILLKMDQQDKKQSRIILTGTIVQQLNQPQLSRVKQQHFIQHQLEVTKLNLKTKEMIVKELIINNQALTIEQMNVFTQVFDADKNEQTEIQIGQATGNFGQNKVKIQLNDNYFSIQGKVSNEQKYYVKQQQLRDWQWQ